MKKQDVSPEELGEVLKSVKPGNRPLIRIRGEAVIKDADGNIKGRMKLFNIEEEEN